MNLMGKKHSYYGNQFPRFSTYSGFAGFSREPISQVFPIRRVFLPFPMLWEIDEKTLTFPLWWSIPQDGNIMGKSAHSMEKVWEPFSQVLPIRWVSLTFLMLWENWCENSCISHVIKYTIGWESNGRKHPKYGKSMTTNFLSSPQTMGFVEYYQKPISQTFLIRWVWLSFFLCYWKLIRKHMHFPCDKVYHKMGI